jgi:hypothetical protein
MAAGPRGLLAFWLGGAGATGQAGVRGLLAPWIGGAGAPSTPAGGGGYVSLLAFWLGGAAAGVAPEPPIQPSGPGAPGHPYRRRLPIDLMRRRQLIEEDELLFLLAARLIAEGVID